MPSGRMRRKTRALISQRMRAVSEDMRASAYGPRSGGYRKEARNGKGIHREA